MTADAASFNGSGHQSRKSRHVIGELTVVPTAGFDLDQGPVIEAPLDDIDDFEATLAAEIHQLLSAGEDESIQAAVDQKRVKLRRMALDYADEPFEKRLGPMPDRRLFLDVPAKGACAFNFRTEEYWVLDAAGSRDAARVWCCGLDGSLRRTLRLDNVPRMFALSFDRSGIFYMCDSDRSCLAFRPVQAQAVVADRFLR